MLYWCQEASVMELSGGLKHLAGVVFEQGGPQTHAAILARSLGIPMVGQVRKLSGVRPGRRLLVDGTTGTLHHRPAQRGSLPPRPQLRHRTGHNLNSPRRRRFSAFKGRGRSTAYRGEYQSAI
jgi:phosphoenolpyruvate-protein kinase (PTS system EI component)